MKGSLCHWKLYAKIFNDMLKLVISKASIRYRLKINSALMKFKENGFKKQEGIAKECSKLKNQKNKLSNLKIIIYKFCRIHLSK